MTITNDLELVNHIEILEERLQEALLQLTKYLSDQNEKSAAADVMAEAIRQMIDDSYLHEIREDQIVNPLRALKNWEKLKKK